MKAEVTKRTDTEITFLITVSEPEIKHAKEHAFEHYRPKVKAAGFRPGKAPDNIVEREIGAATIQTEVVEHAINHAYSDAIFQEKVAPIAHPEIQLKKFVPYNELEFEAKVEVIPPVKLADYKKIKKTLKNVEIKQAEIDEVVEDLRRRVAKRVPAVRAAEMEDEVKFDFTGRKDGKEVPGAAGKNYTLKLGSGTFIPGFEEELVGLKVGDEKKFKITFPKDYHEKTLANQPVEFEVKIHEVTSLELPEVNDKFAAEVGPFKNVKELRADVEDQLKVEAEQKAKRDHEQEVLDEIIKKSEMTVPERMVMQQIERMKAEIEQRLASSGLNMEQYLQAQKQTQEDFEVQMRPEAEKRVKLAMVLSEVSKQENLNVGDEEIEKEIEELRKQYTDPKMQKELESERVREDIFNHLMSGKVVRKLVKYASNN